MFVNIDNKDGSEFCTKPSKKPFLFLNANNNLLITRPINILFFCNDLSLSNLKI